MKNVKQIIRNFGMQLESLGINDFTYSDSVTKFGQSSYLISEGLKVRVSDHSVTNTSRILEELHLNESNWDTILQAVELFFFPERYEEITTLEYGDKIQLGADLLDNQKEDFIVINPCSYVTKKGRVMATIQRRNKVVKTYIRK